MLSKLKEKHSHTLSHQSTIFAEQKNLLYQTCFTMFYTTDNFFKLHSHSIQSLFYFLPKNSSFFSLPNICLLFAKLLPGTTSFRKNLPHPRPYLKIDRVRGFFKLRQHQLYVQNKTDGRPGPLRLHTCQSHPEFSSA
jgi:hypothetical protein